MGQYSQRAYEVARDLLAQIDAELQRVNKPWAQIRFHLDASDVVLSRAEAEEWIQQSVDEGFPNVGYYIEQDTGSELVINLAALEDPDSQYYP